MRWKDFNRHHWGVVIPNGIALASLIMWVYVYVVLTFNGLYYGEYSVVLYSNTVNEHYPELVMFISGLILYIVYMKKIYRRHKVNDV